MDYKELLQDKEIKAYLKREMKTLDFLVIQTIQKSIVPLWPNGPGIFYLNLDIPGMRSCWQRWQEPHTILVT